MAVVGLLIESGRHNPAFDPVWTHLPAIPGETQRVEINEIFPIDPCLMLSPNGQAPDEGVRDFVGGHHRSFPDWSEQVLDIVADGDRVVTRYHSTGTHKGEFQGIAPTGRRVEIAEVSVHRVLGGKIVEQWGFPDGLSHYLQLTESESGA